MAYLRLNTLLFLIFCPFHLHAKEHQILMVISSYYDEKNISGSGYEFDEFAKAYLVFKNNGVSIDIASPNGGKAKPAKFDPNKPFNQLVINDQYIMNKLNHANRLDDVKPKKYDAVFVVGGKGAMFDLPNNLALQNVIAQIYERKGSVAAVCHGPAALVNVKLKNGRYLVENKKVNAFTNHEEKTLSNELISKFDFLLQDQLIKRGALFENAALLLPHVVNDTRLITGQNQHSTGATALSLLKSLGIKNIKTPYFKDEQTMLIIQRIIKGDNSAIKAFHQQPHLFQADLMAMYAHTLANTTQDKKTRLTAVNLMKIAGQYWQHPKLSISLANNLHILGQTDEAKAILHSLLAKEPGMTAAKTLLAKLTNGSK